MNEMQRRLTVSDAAKLYGCCGLLDMCTDVDLMSLSFHNTEPFLDWLTWRPEVNCYIRKSFIAYVRPNRVQGVCTSGVTSDPCADPNTFEWGKCDFELHDFARLRREGPVRDITTKKMMYCANQPRYRLDGSPITDDMEFDMVLATDVLMQDIKHEIIIGNQATPGSFNGVQQLLDSTYHDPAGNPCPLMNSNVINWNGNDMDGGAGITWNGNAVGATYDLVDVLLAVYRRIRQRLSWSPQLARPLTPGDIVLVMPTFLIQCLLDFYTCWSVCSGAAIDTYEARMFRNSLNGGMFGAGSITLDGFQVPIIAYDWDTIAGPTTGDIYFLTGQVGGIRLLEGQYLDMRPAAAAVQASNYAYTDGGRLLTWDVRDHTCVKRVVEFRPRLLCWAPWAQAVINNVKCTGPGGIIVPDACDTSFFPDAGSVDPVACPE
jgi:hypothetical protein